MMRWLLPLPFEGGREIASDPPGPPEHPNPASDVSTMLKVRSTDGIRMAPKRPQEASRRPYERVLKALV